MKTLSPLLILFLFFSACSSTPESERASEEMAWELSDQLEEYPPMVLAVGELESLNIPESLQVSFRNSLGTRLALALKETDQNHQVVTRDKVDQVYGEQSLALTGLTFQESQLKLGQILGADAIITGTMILLEGDLYRTSIQIIDTESGVVLGGSTWDFWFDS
ncbi:MAG: hypothetical protein DRP60_10695 [Spirochaetes bacterium]|nr:MAG: hypothetical protein DRP60_10695 [Spirochaetota bacterium]